MATTSKTPLYGHLEMRGASDLNVERPKMVATVLGGIFLLVGIVGFAVPDLFHAHLGPAHNSVHLVSGAMAFVVGIWGTMAAARVFDLMFGAVYGLLGVAGFVLGSPGAAAVGHDAHDSFLWKVVPDVLELGTADHLIHIAVGCAFLVGGCLGFWTQTRASSRSL